MKIVDTHFHVWNIDFSGWLQPELGPLYATYGADDHVTASAETGVTAAVLIEAGKSPAAQKYAQEIAARHDHIRAYVPYQDLDSSDLSRDLDHWQTDPKVRGVRMGFEQHPDPDILKRPAIVDGLKQLAERGLIFEFLVRPDHLPDVLSVCERIPELTGIIEHLAKPDIIDRSDFDAWSDSISRIAASTQLRGKLSMSMSQTMWPYMKEQPVRGWPTERIQPFVEHMISQFGCGRLLWGSDWPVSLFAASYHETWQMMRNLTNHLDENDRTRIFCDNAITFYQL